MSTYDRLLEIADTLIGKNGFEGFSYADLAKEMGIRKASIHYHFPTKTDLGIAYCELKMKAFADFEAYITTLPVGPRQIAAYIDAFSVYAKKGQMCGVHAMLSDSNLYESELKTAVQKLADYELRIISKILQNGQEAGLLKFDITVEDMALIVCYSVKGALLINRTPPHNASERNAHALLKMLENR
ncbi:TetR/AcrR family transcriptional regulator [Salmonella enterica subsp. diarizonae serovar 48:r:z]